MSKRIKKPGANYISPVWTCPECMAQMLRSGPRCPVHNPTPEQRDADPERYPRGVYIKNDPQKLLI